MRTENRPDAPDDAASRRVARDATTGPPWRRRRLRGALVAAGAVVLVGAAGVAPAVAAETGHAVDAVDLVAGHENPVAVAAFALEALQVIAGLIALASLRTVIGRFEGGAIVRGLAALEGGVAVLVIARLGHLSTVIASVRPMPPVVESAYVLAALLCFAAASVDLYRAL